MRVLFYTYRLKKGSGGNKVKQAVTLDDELAKVFNKRLTQVITDPQIVTNCINFLRNDPEFEEKPVVSKVITAMSDGGEVTQTALALISGRNKSNVSRWINYQSPTLPSLEVIVRLAKGLGVTTDFLLGLDSLPKKETSSKVDALQEYGLSPNSIYNLTRIKEKIEKEKEKNRKDYVKKLHNYWIAIDGMNYLLEQENIEILELIGYFLLAGRFDGYYYFDNDDVEMLFDGLFKSIRQGEFTEDYVRENLKDFFENCPQFSIAGRAIEALEDIKIALREYKEKLMPHYFEPNPNATKFFSSPILCDLSKYDKQNNNSDDKDKKDSWINKMLGD